MELVSEQLKTDEFFYLNVTDFGCYHFHSNHRKWKTKSGIYAFQFWQKHENNDNNNEFSFAY